MSTTYTNIAIAVAGIAIILLVTKLVSRHVEKLGKRREVRPYRIAYISKTLNISATIAILMLVMLMLGIQYSQVWVLFSSVFAVLGVALFAQWSMLSNITASVIIFFFFPYRVGDQVKVVDKDEDISGVIEEIALFHVMIRRGDDLITYPNSLILQKSVIKKRQPEDVARAIAIGGGSSEKPKPGAELAKSVADDDPSTP